jgi:hypothetical protein
MTLNFLNKLFGYDEAVCGPTLMYFLCPEFIRPVLWFMINIFFIVMTAFTDQYSLPNIFFDIGQL